MAKALPASILKGSHTSIPKSMCGRRIMGVSSQCYHASGIGRNDTTKMIEAHDEAWADYVKVEFN
ncbi:hypothetical protein DH2020_026852 [Rehmannia glutinosa]|uniref:Uncharacterized protein n=1 Tax=Rehmannia glutinosa TaxID=99300 RepID=A0ABR0VZV5_REHGL